jgi:hypothetical protein
MSRSLAHGGDARHDELRLVADFEAIGAAEPEYDLRAFPDPEPVPASSC